MTVLSDYVSGTISLTNGSVDFTGTGTGWLLAGFKEGDTIIDITGATEFMGVIASIDTNAGGKLTKPWEGPTLVDAPYRMRYQPDGSRVSAQARNLIELLGDGTLVSLAGLTGPGVIELLAGGGAQVVPKSDLVNGVAYDVQVDTLADRDAYDGQSEGFAVLVSDVGDGRSALYSKNSNAVGDWSDPAYITGTSVSVTVGTTTEGPFGSPPDVTGVTGTGSLQLNFELPGSPSIDATVSSSPPGTTANVVTTPVAGGYELDFTLPEASGFYNAGVYDIAEAYNQDDVVRHNGSSFIALQSVPAGEAPSSASPPVDTAYWQVLAAKGADGLGTGDVVGPSGAVADRIAVYDGMTGKLIKDGGKTVAELDAVKSGALVQTVIATYSTWTALEVQIPIDDTIPQTMTEGTWVITQTFTPKFADSIILLSFSCSATADGLLGVSAYIGRTGVADAIQASRVTIPVANYVVPLAVQARYVPGSVSPITFVVGVGPNTGNAYLNGSATARTFGGSSRAVLEIREIRP